MCCAEAIEIRTVSNNWHCSDNNNILHSLFHVKGDRKSNRRRPASAVGADRDLSNLASRP
jgi:hypothetical protein